MMWVLNVVEQEKIIVLHSVVRPNVDKTIEDFDDRV